MLKEPASGFLLNMNPHGQSTSTLNRVGCVTGLALSPSAVYSGYLWDYTFLMTKKKLYKNALFLYRNLGFRFRV